MSGKTCQVCNKVAYPMECTTVSGLSYHKLCFRCSVCKGTLSLKNFKLKNNTLYCATHYPVDGATPVADDVTTRHASNAPKKAAEGLSTVYKGDSRTRKEANDFQTNQPESSGTYEGGGGGHEEAAQSYGGEEEAYAGGEEEQQYYEEGAAQEEGYEEQY